VAYPPSVVSPFPYGMYLWQLKKNEIISFFLQHIVTRFVSYLKDNLRKEMIK
jgi:hypothetical protein